MNFQSLVFVQHNAKLRMVAVDEKKGIAPRQIFRDGVLEQL